MLKKQKTKEERCIVIGIIGLQSGVGVTYISILLAEFLYTFTRKKVIVLEHNRKNDFNKLIKKTQKEDEFIYHGVQYVTSEGRVEPAYYKNLKYNFCILDLGHIWEQEKLELLRCDLKIIIGGSAPWQKQAWEILGQFLNSEIEDISSYRFIINLQDTSDKDICKNIPTKPFTLGYEPDLSKISTKTVSLFCQLLSSYIK